MLPTERTACISPVQGMDDRYCNRKVVERMMQWEPLFFFTIFIGTFIYMMMLVIPVVG